MSVRINDQMPSFSSAWMTMGLLAIVLLSLLFCSNALAQAPDGIEGTVGIDVQQLHAGKAPNGFGYLVVGDVAEATSASKAGIQNGDIILEIDGASVLGKPLVDAAKPLKGNVGGKVHLKLLRPLESRVFEVDLVRAPYAPRSNPAREVFGYRWMADWRLECDSFPLDWAPQMRYQGTEDLVFMPKFDDKGSPQYHSYGFVWWLEGMQPLTLDGLQSDLLEYYKGLSVRRGRNNNFNPDLNRVSIALGLGPLGGAPPARPGPRQVHGDITFYARDGELITLHGDIAVESCQQANHTAAIFILSPQRDEAVWKDLRAFQNSFRCNRK
ncbi:MAG TPA: PDZ domain-containing protein [Blastocatellia bacterium]